MDGKTVSRSNVIGKIEVGDDSVLNLTQQLVVSHEPASTLVPAELPAPAEMFDRKEESKQFESHVNSGCHLLYIGGMPGVGKTTCLAKWANMVKSEYPDGQLYLDASKFVSAGVTVSCELQKTVLRSFGVSGINAMNEQETERAYRSWTSEKRLLIAVDNVIDDSVIRALKPNSANALMIVAGCRNPNRRSLDEIILKLECFHPRDAKGYLEGRGCACLPILRMLTLLLIVCERMKEASTPLSRNVTVWLWPWMARHIFSAMDFIPLKMLLVLFRALPRTAC